MATIDMRDAFFDQIHAAALEDPNLIFLTADMGAFSLEAFQKAFPTRFINVGIAEQNLINLAAGLALAGKRVFAYAIVPFVTLRCLEQIKSNLIGMHLPVTLVGVGAGYTYGPDGPTHHGVEDVAILRTLPGLTLWNPSDAALTAACARWCCTSQGPAYVRVERGQMPDLYATPPDVTQGLATLRPGRDVTLLATGFMTQQAVVLAEELAAQGVDAGVVDLFRLKPIHSPALLASLAHSRRLVTLEENLPTGGLAAAVLETLADANQLRPMLRLALPDGYTPLYGEREWLLQQEHLDRPAMAHRIRQWLEQTA